MPKDFNKCVRKGGTSGRGFASGNNYVNVCYLGSKSVKGDPKKIKTKKFKKSNGYY